MDELFDAALDRWDAYCQSSRGRLRRELVVKNLVRHGLIGTGKKILDAGGGVGDLALELARRGDRVIMMDVSPVMVAVASERAKKAGLDNLDCVCADVATIEKQFPKDHFDVILAHSLLEFLPDPGDRLDWLGALLAPGGALSLVFSNRYHYVFRHALQTGKPDLALEALESDAFRAGVDLFGLPRRVFEVADVERMIEKSGLTVVGHHGLRIFVDHLDNHAFDPDTWLDLEAKAGSHPAFWQMGRFIQLIATKEGRNDETLGRNRLDQQL